MNLSRLVESSFKLAINVNKSNSAVFEISRKNPTGYNFALNTVDVSISSPTIFATGIYLSDVTNKDVRVRKVAFRTAEIGDLSIISSIKDGSVEYRISKILVKGKVTTVFEVETNL